MPERHKNIQLFLSIILISLYLPVINTINHAIINTTAVRMAVPKLDSTPTMPILASIAVRLANKADNRAYTSHVLLNEAVDCSRSTFFLYTIKYVPKAMATIPMDLGKVTGSRRIMMASIMVSTVLNLSIGVTLLTSPSCKALK